MAREKRHEPPVVAAVTTKPAEDAGTTVEDTGATAVPMKPAEDAGTTAVPGKPAKDVREQVRKVPVVRATKAPLYEPYLAIRFPVGQDVKVPEITNWIECQIEAGLMEVVG